MGNLSHKPTSALPADTKVPHQRLSRREYTLAINILDPANAHLPVSEIGRRSGYAESTVQGTLYHKLASDRFKQALVAIQREQLDKAQSYEQLSEALIRENAEKLETPRDKLAAGIELAKLAQKAREIGQGPSEEDERRQAARQAAKHQIANLVYRALKGRPAVQQRWLRSHPGADRRFR
jgi:hypothetical protein